MSDYTESVPKLGKTVIIGSGNWGTTLALLFSQKHKVHLWTISQKEADEINQTGENKPFLPGIKLGKNVLVEKKFSREIKSNDVIIIAIPSRKVIDLIDEFLAAGIEDCIILNASKGVKHSTLLTVGQHFFARMPKIKFATLSGPTIARELAEGQPAKAVLASKNVALLLQLQSRLENDRLKFEFSRDIKGVELAASLKGIIAIAVGISDGLGFQSN
ncbi:MAG: NAD(P)-binding domain-containing protein, partial [Candidatus Cloacimonetes bacterium]|nr:NAD(P)-binding domain-containing protein [Candidatus Cloacimonadota bacterium]